MAYKGRKKESKTELFHKDIANSFFNALKEGELPWKSGVEGGILLNPVSGHEYRGIRNQRFLEYAIEKMGFQDTRFLTYNQIEKKGYTFNKALCEEKKEKTGGWLSVPITFRQPMMYGIDENGKKKYESISWQTYYLMSNEGVENIYVVDKTYRVFNAGLLEGIEPYIKADRPSLSDKYMAIRDDIIAGLSLKFEEKVADTGYYIRADDTVVMPLVEQYENQDVYMATFLHEVSHSTMAESRLNQNYAKGIAFEDAKWEAKAKEELLADISSSYLCKTFNIKSAEASERSIAYIQNWASAIDEDKREEVLFDVLKEAEKVERFVLKSIGCEKDISKYLSEDEVKDIGYDDELEDDEEMEF